MSLRDGAVATASASPSLTGTCTSKTSRTDARVVPTATAHVDGGSRSVWQAACTASLMAASVWRAAAT